MTVWLWLIFILINKIFVVYSVQLQFSSKLTTNHSKYSRKGDTVLSYYYEAISVQTPVNGNFTFTSKCAFDIYGYLYKSRFDPQNATKNLLIGNDDGGDGVEFLLRVHLQYGIKYILVVTTFGSNVIGSYGISISGTTNYIMLSKINASPKKIAIRYNGLFSYNQPRFCSDTGLDSNGTTIATESILGNDPWSIFVDWKNSIYVINRQSNRILIWDNDTSAEPSKNIKITQKNLSSIFVTVSNDIYIATVAKDGRIIKLNQETGTQTVWLTIKNGSCFGFFIDIYDNLYCSLHYQHKIVRVWLHEPNGELMTVAGTGYLGNVSNTFNHPWGIFVTNNSDLYVADSGNNRIQLFQGSSTSGRTIAGNRSVPVTIELSYPTAVTLDGNGEIWIVDSFQHRIIRSYENSFSCIIGCSEDDKLNRPRSMAFDNDGNGYVIDSANNRMQKFLKNPRCTCPHPKFSLETRNTSYAFNQDIFITSKLRFTCEHKYSIRYQWTISNYSNSDIRTTSDRLYIPARTLPFNRSEIHLLINILTLHNNVSVGQSITITILRSNRAIIKAIQSGLSSVTLGQQQELLLEPDKYSIDGDGFPLTSDWKYKFYCRVYPYGVFSIIEKSACFSKPSNQVFEYGSFNGSLKVLKNAFQSDQTYQFMIEVKKSSNLYISYLFIQVQQLRSYRIAIRRTMSIICEGNCESFQLINPSTQIALRSECIDIDCPKVKDIIWKISQGKFISSNNITNWSSFNEQILTFGNHSDHFAVTNDLFTRFNQIQHWQIEVIYLFDGGKGSSSINFKINQPPSGIQCVFGPYNGTITTVFRLSCLNWKDEHGIKDYTFYARRNGRSERIFLGSTTAPILDVRLPAGDRETSAINLIVEIQDQLNCIREYYYQKPVYVSDQIVEIQNLFDDFKNSKTNFLTNNSLIDILSNSNENDVAGLIGSISEQFNKVDYDGSIESSSNETEKDRNVYANIREYLIDFTSNSTIPEMKTIIGQASALVQLTEGTHQLTRQTAIIASKKCYNLSVRLYEIFNETSMEEIQNASTLLSQCVTNILNSIHGVLQDRRLPLDMDIERSMENSTNSTMDNKEINLSYQKQIADQMLNETNQTMFLISSILSNRLAVNQTFSIEKDDFSAFYQSKMSTDLANQTFQHMHFPVNFSLNNTADVILIESKLEVLAPYGDGQANTNYSNALTLNFFDKKNQSEFKIQTDQLIEFVIPRDPKLPVPELSMQNVTGLKKLFHYKFIDLDEIKRTNHDLSFALNFQIASVDRINTSYAFIYRFDRKKQYDKIDFFCYSNNSEFYEYFIDNQQLSKYHSLIFGLRELTSVEYENICETNSTQDFKIKNPDAVFTSNYYLRIYTSGCYYLDENNRWQSDGLVVGPKTNLFQTHCFTNHA